MSGLGVSDAEVLVIAEAIKQSFSRIVQQQMEDVAGRVAALGRLGGDVLDRVEMLTSRVDGIDGALERFYNGVEEGRYLPPTPPPPGADEPARLPQTEGPANEFGARLDERRIKVKDCSGWSCYGCPSTKVNTQVWIGSSVDYLCQGCVDELRAQLLARAAGLPERSAAVLYEHLAAIEHQRWADWQRYMHSLCTRNADGTLTIPVLSVANWERQIITPYAELSEREKQSDREQVDRYWHLVKPA